MKGSGGLRDFQSVRHVKTIHTHAFTLVTKKE